MANLTDPARELYEITERVRVGSSDAGAIHLAGMLNVEPWSSDLMRIIASVLERADQVESIIAQSETYDEDMKVAAASDLAAIKRAFASQALTESWHNSTGGLGLLNDHAPRIKYLSAEVRRTARYPRLTSEESDELVELIRRYLEDLDGDPDVPDFARAAIASGLKDFVFRLTKLQWAGAAYTLAGFRELASLYGALRQQVADPQQLQSAIWLHGLGRLLANFKHKAETAKGYTDALAYAYSGYALLAPVLMLPAPFE